MANKYNFSPNQSKEPDGVDALISLGYMPITKDDGTTIWTKGNQATSPISSAVGSAINKNKPTVSPKVAKVAAPALAGLEAAQNAGPSYDMTSGLVNVGAATAAGAASGAMVGGPVGAVIGGGVGLVTSGLNAWLQVRQENKDKADMNRLLREIEEKQARKERIARQDQLAQIRYDRKQTEFNKSWNAANAQRDQITNLINQNTTLRDRFIQSGVRNAFN